MNNKLGYVLIIIGFILLVLNAIDYSAENIFHSIFVSPDCFGRKSTFLPFLAVNTISIHLGTPYSCLKSRQAYFPKRITFLNSLWIKLCLISRSGGELPQQFWIQLGD